MKLRIASIIFMILTMCLVPVGILSNDVQPAHAVTVQQTDVVNCTSIRISTTRVEIKCTAAGIVVLDTTVPLPAGPTVTVTLPQATVTVHVPGPSATATKTVTVPGPTNTVTANGPTSTATVTKTPSPRPTKTVTITTTPTRQVDNPSGTVDPSPTTPTPSVITIPGPTTVKGAVLGTISILILVALLLLTLFGGYTLGYREADVANATFMKRVLKK